MNTRIMWPGFAVCALLLPSAAGATQLLPATLEQMAAAAEIVVVGRLTEGAGRFEADRGLVLTHATILVDEVLKGEVRGRAVPLLVPGGTDGVRWTEVIGAPAPGPPGARVVAFLYADERGRLSNVVYWQGLFHLEGGRVRENGRPAAAFLDEVRAAVRGAGRPAPGVRP